MLGEMIKKYRLNYRISQVTLAKALGVSKQSVSNWENDNIQPSIEILIKLAEYFSVSTDSLLGISTDTVIDVSGLNDSEKAHIRILIEDLRAAHGSNIPKVNN